MSNVAGCACAARRLARVPYVGVRRSTSASAGATVDDWAPLAEDTSMGGGAGERRALATALGRDGERAGDRRDGERAGDRRDGERAGDRRDGVRAGDRRALIASDIADGGCEGDLGGRGARTAAVGSMREGLLSLATAGGGPGIDPGSVGRVAFTFRNSSSSSSHAASTSSMLRTEFATSTAVRAVGPPSVRTSFWKWWLSAGWKLGITWYTGYKVRRATLGLARRHVHGERRMLGTTGTE